MKILADGPEFAAKLFVQCANLLADGSAARGDHFRHEQARENAVFFRDVAANGEPGAFFAAQRDFVFADELADVFEAHGRLMDGLAVQFGDRIDHVRRRDAARRGHFPFARFDEIVVHEREDQVGLDPRAVVIDDAEAVGVTIGGQARGCFGIDHSFAQRREIFFGDVGPGPIEQAIALRAHALHRDTVIGERAVQIAGAAAVERVDYQRRLCLAQRLEMDEFFDALQIVFAEIDFFAG